MKFCWKSAAKCVQDMLANFAVVGVGLAIYEQKLWPALLVGVITALMAISIALVVKND